MQCPPCSEVSAPRRLKCLTSSRHSDLAKHDGDPANDVTGASSPPPPWLIVVVAIA